ncbi:MAG TPA: DUF1592 domain-containing protein [Lacipirellulaceae bacterium]|nr:DUF1592 domain-containing protein [Lacipirellulaceae bacterium]
MRLPQSNLRSLLPASLAVLLPAVFTSLVVAAAPGGEQIYHDQCARCHGPKGEGTTDNYPDPLEGDKSVAQLTKYIHKSMPDDLDTKVPADDAAKVAAFIYEAFYSPEARVRNKPARVELARLTVRQYQNAVADLIGSFRGFAEWGSVRGLQGAYSDSRYIGDGKKHFERTDPQVDFKFGDESPDPKKFDAKEFSVRWHGSVFAPDTGDYDFVIRTQHAARLFVNDMQNPLIDGWVKSGNDSEQRATIRLLGGRAYPIRLEFSKANQGVNDKDKKKRHLAPPKAFISLAWQRPNHTLEVIPSRNLSVIDSPEVFVVQAHFPPDDRSVGYERGTSVSKAWDEATTEGAIEVATYVVDHLNQLAGANAENPKSESQLRDFCTRFAERAFRRPLAAPQKKLYVDHQFAKMADPIGAIKRVVLLVLKSPRFLYREVGGTPGNEYDTAARLSFGLWDSLPDKPLETAAAEGKLATRGEVTKQLQRMLPNMRTRSKLRDFFLSWLKISEPRDLSKDPKLYPEFTPDVISDLRTSMELSINDVLSSKSADYRQFMLSDATYLDGRLAKVYGVKLPADAPFTKVDFEPKHRAGVLSHPYLLASLAYTNASSPIHRGVFLTRNVLGRVLRPPPKAQIPLPPDLHAGLTTRERVALQTQPQACQGCHGMINPLGFTMENFDAIGRFREVDSKQRVDSTGSYVTQSGEIEKFKGEKDLAAFVASSKESQDAFVKKLFQHTVKQPIRAYGPHCLRDLQQSFEKNDYNIQKLLTNIVATSALPK